MESLRISGLMVKVESGQMSCGHFIWSSRKLAEDPGKSVCGQGGWGPGYYDCDRVTS